jgi:hypothetical protein
MSSTNTRSLATLPFALLLLAQMAATIPASLYMQRVGRCPAFMTSAVVGMAGAATATLGIFRADFSLFCLGPYKSALENGYNFI